MTVVDSGGSNATVYTPILRPIVSTVMLQTYAPCHFPAFPFAGLQQTVCRQQVVLGQAAVVPPPYL
jgi:hypothetical protein